jgi:hypothetical protein
MFRVPDSLNMISSIFVYICEIKGVFFVLTNNSSVLIYLFRGQISSNLLGIYAREDTMNKASVSEMRCGVWGVNFVFLTGCRFLFFSIDYAQ